MSTTTTKKGPPAGATRKAPIDPRISARRTAIARQQGRRRLWVLVSIAVVATLGAGVWFVLQSPVFSARALTVSGAVHETAAQVEAAAGLSTHPPLMDVRAGASAVAVERLAWVRTATVSTHWPDGVHITVTERVPKLAMAASNGTWAELTADGRVLALDAAQPPGLVVVTGPQPPGIPGSFLGPADQAGIRVASTLPVSFAAQVTAVHVEPGGWVQLAMTTPILVNIGTATQLPAKYEDVTAILAGATLHSGDVIDVSVPGAPTVAGG
ncbi:MAG TPA: FtsQ-type POTRA domain-containing protein [Acidimicrobiales bacterium]|nr:FtsQ-type POTRA domain-containing protein [Acidimicrobiales bacterium]